MRWRLTAQSLHSMNRTWRSFSAAYGAGVKNSGHVGTSGAKLVLIGMPISPLAGRTPWPGLTGAGAALVLLLATTVAHADPDADLMQAAGAGDAAQLQGALAQGAKPDARGERETTALMQAAENGHLAVVDALLAAGADPNAERAGEITALMHAAASGNAEVVQHLLNAGARVNERAGAQGLTALRVAVATGSAAIARLLLDAGADRDELDEDGARLLFTAAGTGSVPLLELLLTPDEDVDHQRREGGYTALDVALERHHWTAAQFLLDQGATLAASVTGREGVLRKLLDLQPVLNPGKANTLVQVAEMPSAALFAAVLRQGASTAYRDDKGNTLLMLAARRHHATAVEALLAAGVDVHARNAEGDTALSIASGKTEYELIVAGIGMALGPDRESLMRVIFRPAAKSHESASTARRLQVARMLLAARADPNAADSGGNTPLMEATRTADAELVTLLISSGAGVNVRNRAGTAPVLMAAQFGLHEITMQLLAARADVSVRDQDGKAAIDLARAGGHASVVELLQGAPRN